MKKKILINACYPEIKRVAIVQGNDVVDFSVEIASRGFLKGNIYKGVVSRVEPGLQAAFVDFGQKKQGFLQKRELSREYFKEEKPRKGSRIQNILAKGQEIIVQVEKEERDTKGASLTTYLSLPGRYLVMMPGQERVGVSRKIEQRAERDRVKEIFKSLKLPKDTGFILRTACSDRTEEELSNDLKYLTKLWSRIQMDSKKEKAPALIYQEQDIAVRTVRDYLTTDVSEVVVDDVDTVRNIKSFLRKTVPWRKINVRIYKDKKPLFTKYQIEDQIARMHDRYVHLPSRGYIVFDKTEALTAIDVNSGRSRKEENVEATALNTNLEAADEVARQIRLRDIGGLIVVDFIDMASSRNRKEVEKRLKNALSTDKAHTDISGISKFGIIEMTRERLRPAFYETVSRKCECCGGSGTILTDELLAVAILRDIHAKVSDGGVSKVSCRLPVESSNYLVNAKKGEIASIEKGFSVEISIVADRVMAPGKYSIDFEKKEVTEENTGKS